MCYKENRDSARFWAKVAVTNEDKCWEWIPGAGRRGHVLWGDRMELAHRVAYRLLHGEIPAGLVLDHLCMNQRCVNPDHLEPVTQGENMRRARLSGAMDPGKHQRDKTECPLGHPYSGANLRIDGGKRTCRKCRNAACIKRYQTRKLAEAR